MAFIVPRRLAANCRKTPEGAAWLNGLPDALRHVETRWGLRLGPPFDEEMSCAWVAPVTLKDGTSAVLKLGMPHMEGEHEIEGLRFWNGDPTVRLLEADEEASAMLLEPCKPGTHLRALPESEQDRVIAGLLCRLWRSPSSPHAFRPLSAMIKAWCDETLADVDRWPDAGLVREGLRLLQELPRTAARKVLLTTDLHAGNVLRSEREPWLVIDPKPFVGDPAFDATQHLLNCHARLSADPDELIGRMADLVDLERERVRLWMFARLAADPRSDWTSNNWISIARAIAP